MRVRERRPAITAAVRRTGRGAGRDRRGERLRERRAHSLGSHLVLRRRWVRVARVRLVLWRRHRLRRHHLRLHRRLPSRRFRRTLRPAAVRRHKGAAFRVAVRRAARCAAGGGAWWPSAPAAGAAGAAARRRDCTPDPSSPVDGVGFASYSSLRLGSYSALGRFDPDALPPSSSPGETARQVRAPGPGRPCRPPGTRRRSCARSSRRSRPGTPGTRSRARRGRSTAATRRTPLCEKSRVKSSAVDPGGRLVTDSQDEDARTSRHRGRRTRHDHARVPSPRPLRLWSPARARAARCVMIDASELR